MSANYLKQLFEIRDGGQCRVRNTCVCFHPLQPKIICINDKPQDWLRAVDGITGADEEPMKKMLFYWENDHKKGLLGPPFSPKTGLVYQRDFYKKTLNNDMQAKFNAICLKGKAISIISKSGFITGKWNDKNAIQKLLLGNSL